MKSKLLKVSLAQLSPIWLDKKASLAKVQEFIKRAARDNSELVIFGECLVPGYPYWLSYTGGAKFNNQQQKEIFAHYLKEAVTIENGDLDEICALAKAHSIAVYLGILERPKDRSYHSCYCTLVYINQEGLIVSTHRKLQPTYDERLVWAQGDGNGLVVHELKDFKLGGLNCWENWMPLSRTALYAQGENLHVAVWPGCERNTKTITRFIAEESRSYAISVSGLFGKKDILDHIPHADFIRDHTPEKVSNGGSCIALPTGEWLVEPILEKEGVFSYELDINRVYEERQNFDPAGHYSRPSVTSLLLNQERQSLLKVIGS